MRVPSALAMTTGSPPSSAATTELVVPRSIPTARAICLFTPCDQCPASSNARRVSLKVLEAVGAARTAPCGVACAAP